MFAGRRTEQAFLCAVIGMALAGIAFDVWITTNVQTIGRQFRQTVETLGQRIMESEQQTLTTTWKSGGIERALETKRQAEESDEDFVDRHASAESEAFQRWPVDDR